jgi:hypothetical protein
MPYTRIRIEQGGELAGDGREVQENGAIKANQTTGRVAVTSVFANLALQQGKQALSYGVSQIGNFTGDYTLQRNIEVATGIVGDVATLGIGFLSGGPVGLAVAGVSVGFKYAMQAVSYSVDQWRVGMQNDMLSTRSGNSLNNVNGRQ